MRNKTKHFHSNLTLYTTNYLLFSDAHKKILAVICIPTVLVSCGTYLVVFFFWIWITVQVKGMYSTGKGSKQDLWFSFNS